MAYRIFTDSTGVDWHVWDIVPRLSERRTGEVGDRRVRDAPISFRDRRFSPRRIGQTPRANLRGTYAHGWLCFDSFTEKRRLTPIPADWTSCSEERLAAYAEDAEPVATVRRASASETEPFADAG